MTRAHVLLFTFILALAPAPASIDGPHVWMPELTVAPPVEFTLVKSALSEEEFEVVQYAVDVYAHLRGDEALLVDALVGARAHGCTGLCLPFVVEGLNAALRADLDSVTAAARVDQSLYKSKLDHPEWNTCWTEVERGTSLWTDTVATLLPKGRSEGATASQDRHLCSVP